MKLPATPRPDQNWSRLYVYDIWHDSPCHFLFSAIFQRNRLQRAQIGYLYAIGPLISMFSNMIWSYTSDKYRTIKRIMNILIIGQLVTMLVLWQVASFGVVLITISLFYFSTIRSIRWRIRWPSNGTEVRTRLYRYSRIRLTRLRVLRACHWICHQCRGCVGHISYRHRHRRGHAALLVSSPRRSCDQVGACRAGDLLKILRSKEILWFFGRTFCLAIAHRMNEAFLTLTLSELGAGEGLIGWSLMVSAASEIPIFFLLSKYGDKMKELPLLTFASLMFALRFLLMALAADPLSVLAVQSLHSITFGVFYVTAVRYITRIIPWQYRATGMALFIIFWSSVSGLLSGAFGGLLFEAAGRPAFYQLATLLAFIAGLGFLYRHLLPSRRI